MLLLCENVLLVTLAWEPATSANHWSDVSSTFVGEIEALDRETGKMQKEKKI